MAQLYISEAIREAMREEMRRDERVFCIGEDIGIEKGFGGAFTVTLGLSEEFGHDRVIDTPISEAGYVGIAVGAAMMGMRPIIDFQYCDFLYLAMDQLINNMAKLRYMSGGTIRMPVVLRAPVGATTRGAQHAQSVESFFMHVPGLKIACPSTAYDAKGLLKSAVRDDNPVMFFEHKQLYGSKGTRKVEGGIDVRGDVPEEEYLIPFGQGRIVREGKHITLVATHKMVYESTAAADALAKEGIEVEVMDPRTLVPFDWEMLYASLEKTGRLAICHEATYSGGWAAEIVARVTEERVYLLDAPVCRITAPDTPVPFAPVMENRYVPNAERIAQSIRPMLQGGR